MSLKINNAIKFPCKSVNDVFKIWLTFLTPIHKLTPSVIDLAAELLKHRFELKQSISNDSILDRYLINNVEVRSEILKSCNISLSNYHVGMGKLKRAGFFLPTGEVNPKFIPKLTTEDKQFSMLLLLDFNNGESISGSSKET